METNVPSNMIYMTGQAGRIVGWQPTPYIRFQRIEQESKQPATMLMQLWEDNISRAKEWRKVPLYEEEA